MSSAASPALLLSAVPHCLLLYPLLLPLLLLLPFSSFFTLLHPSSPFSSSSSSSFSPSSPPVASGWPVTPDATGGEEQEPKLYLPAAVLDSLHQSF